MRGPSPLAVEHSKERQDANMCVLSFSSPLLARVRHCSPRNSAGWRLAIVGLCDVPQLILQLFLGRLSSRFAEFDRLVASSFPFPNNYLNTASI